MVYSLLLFANIRVILSKTYVVFICGKYNALTLQFKIRLHMHIITGTGIGTGSGFLLLIVICGCLYWRCKNHQCLNVASKEPEHYITLIGAMNIAILEQF